MYKYILFLKIGQFILAKIKAECYNINMKSVAKVLKC